MNCRALKRVMNICGASVAVFGFALAAHAQNAPEDRTPPPSPPPASEEQPPAEKLPPCPTGEAGGPAPPAPVPPAPTAAKHHNIIFAPQEFSVTTGAGPANYFGSAMNGTIDVGAGWDARLTLGTRSIMGIELAYVGASNSIDMSDGQHGKLSSNGLDSDFRLQLPIFITPYIFGGVGYNHLSVTQSGGGTVVSNAGPLNQSTDTVTVPAGGGVQAYIGKHANVDLRGTYRLNADNDLTVMNTSRLHQWVAQARFGYVF